MSLYIPAEVEARATKVLELRSAWLDAAIPRSELLPDLEWCLWNAIPIAMSLPEYLLRQLLPCSEGADISQRTAQIGPMQLLLEQDVFQPELLLSSVLASPAVFRGATWLGRYRDWLSGNFAFVGPMSHAVSTLPIAKATSYRRCFGITSWGPPADQSLYQELQGVFGDVLSREFEVNWRLAEALERANLGRANFGSVLTASGIKGCIRRHTAKLLAYRRVQRLRRTLGDSSRQTSSYTNLPSPIVWPPVGREKPSHSRLAS